MLVVYVHKQDEREQEGLISTGWEALLEAVLAAGLGVVGTWPVEASSATKMIAQGANALASYVSWCADPDLRRQESPTGEVYHGVAGGAAEALRKLQQAGIAPVDLPQAAIGPGMAVFSRYARVNEPDGSAMRVRTALALINQVLDEVQSQQEGDLAGYAVVPGVVQELRVRAGRSEWRRHYRRRRTPRSPGSSARGC